MCTATMMVENGVTKITAMTCQGTIEALRDNIPAVSRILDFQKGRRSIRVVRNSGSDPTTEDGRPVKIKDGSVVFGTADIPIENVEFLDEIRPNDWVAQSGRILTGSAVAGARPSFRLILVGQFLSTDDGTYLFKTGGSVFRAIFGSNEPGRLPLMVDVKITAELDPTTPNDIRVLAYEK